MSLAFCPTCRVVYHAGQPPNVMERCRQCFPPTPNKLQPVSLPSPLAAEGIANIAEAVRLHIKLVEEGQARARAAVPEDQRPAEPVPDAPPAGG